MASFTNNLFYNLPDDIINNIYLITHKELLNKCMVQVIKYNNPIENYCMGLSIKWMKNLELFDNIPYKYIKDVIYDDLENNRYPLALEVEIKELDCDKIGYCKTQYKINIPQMGENDDEEFTIIKEYSNCGYYALLMIDLNKDEDEEDEDEN